MGLAPMSPVVDGTLTANMVNLVYAEPLSAYVDRKSVEGSTIRFHIRDGLAVPSAELTVNWSCTIWPPVSPWTLAAALLRV